jgi:hypothetical protein
MNLNLINKLRDLRTKDRAQVTRFMSDRKLRLKVVKEMQKKGIGVGVDPDNVAKWIELILKFLPAFIQIILMFV